MKTGRYFISTGFRDAESGHCLVALRKQWRLSLVRPHGKPGYRRLYIGPFEIEWSRRVGTPSPQPNVDVEDVREQKLATIVAPDNGTPDEVLSYVLECAKAWVPEARIIGNARAGDIARAIEALPSPQKHVKADDLADTIRRGIKDQGYGYTLKGDKLTVSSDEVFAIDIRKLADFIIAATTEGSADA